MLFCPDRPAPSLQEANLPDAGLSTLDQAATPCSSYPLHFFLHPFDSVALLAHHNGGVSNSVSSAPIAIKMP
jgi:hypothetical protein